MNESNIAKADFDEGIKLFVEFLKSQPNFLLPNVAGAEPGEFLAKQASRFAQTLYRERTQHCSGSAG